MSYGITNSRAEVYAKYKMNDPETANKFLVRDKDLPWKIVGLCILVYAAVTAVLLILSGAIYGGVGPVQAHIIIGSSSGSAVLTVPITIAVDACKNRRAMHVRLTPDLINSIAGKRLIDTRPSVEL